MPVIEVSDVTKCYPPRRARRTLTGRGGLGALFGSKTTSSPVLREVSLSVEPGQTIGIIGRNGSGKSTLLKLIAGVTLPTQGRVQVHGRVASLLELGAGFHPMLTGRENIYLNAGLLGMRAESVDTVFDQLVEFSGIAAAIDQPVDTYSSGMYVRLGFAVAVHSNPDVFLVDEVLAVGDEEFQRKCRRKIGELKEAGKTIVFVSHDLGTVHALCDRVVLLQEGRLLDRGNAQATIDFYLRQVGGESGIHLMRSDAQEVVFSHGRLSLFQDQREYTAPQGITCSLTSLGSTHTSPEAEWDCTLRGPGDCVATGRFTRLPGALRWETHLTHAGLDITLDLELDRECTIEHLGMLLPFSLDYLQWHHGDLAGAFPTLSPDQVQPSILVPPTHGVTEVALVSASDSAPALTLALRDPHPYLRFQVQNSDYMTGARFVYVGMQVPQSELPLPQGRHRILALELRTARDAESIEARQQARRDARTLHTGAVSAVLAAGQAALLHAEKPLSTSLHLHTQLRAGDLWLMSQALQWEPVQREGDTLHLTGVSVRLPGAQHWRMWPTRDGVDFEVSLELTEAFCLQEYNISLALNLAYTHWRAPREAGEFPPIPQDQHEWVHLNRDYAVGEFIEAHGADLPAVRLESRQPNDFRPTAINPAHAQQARVLQLLRTPGPSGAWTLPPGRHVLFQGGIRIKGTVEQSDETPVRLDGDT